MNPRAIRIGTRGSPLALAQTDEVRHRLRDAFPDGRPLETSVIKTTGDMVLDRPLAEIGGKGLFTREIDAAMLEGRIDLAVHSAKDLPTDLPDGIVLGAILPREDPRDAFIASDAGGLADLPTGAVLGTASLRRMAQVLCRRPDLTVIPLRGNVQTRLTRVREGHVHATLLALAGLRRLGMVEAATSLVPTEDILPAVGQGAIGITCRSNDEDSLRLLDALNHPNTAACVLAERAMLTVLEGSCRTPIAGLAEIDADGALGMRGLVARPDGSEVLSAQRSGAAADAASLGADLGEELRGRAGPGFFDAQ